jgi:hypothetical protein
MRFGVGVLALLVAATVPALFFSGATTLRGLGWLVLLGLGAVLLIDLGDRLTEWVERRRWGRLARRRQELGVGRDALRRRRARRVGEADVLQQQAHQPDGGDREELRGVKE